MIKRVSNQDNRRLNPIGSQFSIPVLWNLCSGSARGMKFWDPVEDSDKVGPSSITVSNHRCFSILVLWSLWSTIEGETESIFLLISVLWRCFNRWWMRGGGDGAESLITGQLKLHLFPAGILAVSNKHDTFWYVVSTEYFYVLFLES